MSVAYMKGKIEEYKKYFNTVLIGDLIIGGVLFIIGIIFSLFIDYILNVPIDIVRDVRLLFFLTFLTFYFTTVSTVFFATGHVKDRLDIVNSIKSLSYIVEILILVFAYLLFRPTVWHVGFAALLASVVLFIGTVLMTNRLIPEARLKFSQFDKSSMIKLVLNGLWNSANSMGNALNTGLDLLVSNLFLEPLSMGQISVAKTINGLIFTLYATIAQPFQPVFLKKYSANDTEGLINELKYSMKVCGVITNVIFTGFCVLGIEFYKLWLPTQDIQLVNRLTVLSMLPCISEGCIYPLYYIYTIKVKNRIPCIIVITTAIVMNFINLVTNPLYMCYCLNINWKTFYPNIFTNFLCIGASLCVMRFVVYVMPCGSGWIYFIVQTLICAILGLFVQVLIAFRPKEIKQGLLRIQNRIRPR